MSFFASLKQSFLEVPEDGRIKTESFLEAVKSMIQVLDLVGPGVFTKIKSMVMENAERLESKYETDREKFSTLQSFVETEKEDGTTKLKTSSTMSIILLKRMLTFVSAIFEEVLTMNPSLWESVTKAYERTIKQYHGWFLQKIIGLAFRGIATREIFMVSLSNGASEDDVLKEMQTHLDLITKNVKCLNEFYERMGEERHEKV